jgi:hypothetical protein
MYRRAPAGCATLLVAVVFAMQIVGCGDDDGNVQSPAPTPTPTPLLTVGETAPEDLILNMAKSVLEALAKKEAESLFFPSMTIDYQTLMNDFLNAVKLALDQQTIMEQEGDVNGEMTNLNESNTRFLATDPSDTTGINDIYSLVIAEEAPVNETLGVLEVYPQQSLAGWMSGAQVKLGFLALEIQLNAIRNPTNLAVQTDLATAFDQFIDYAVDIRSSILYANIQNTVKKVGGCHNVDETYKCGNNECISTHTVYTDCNGNEHQYQGDNNSDCNTARSANIESCAANEYDTENPKLAWMDDVLNTWRDSLAGMADQIAEMSKPCAICQDAYSFITVDQATISINGDLPPGTPQDATEWLQAACNGRQTCDFKLAHADFGEPGPFTLVDVSYRCGSDPTQHNVSISGAGNPQLSEGAYIHLDCAQRIASMQATFRGQPLQPGSEVDVSTHSQPGPSAAKITDGIYAPNGTAYNDTQYAIVLPNVGAAFALTIDLGGVYPLFGGDSVFPPKIEADHNDVYHVDYSTDGIQWSSWADFPTVSSGGLQGRIATSAPAVDAARYVRVYATSGDGAYSVSELQVAFLVQNISFYSTGKPAYGPEPLITNGEYAPAGTAYNDDRYATVLAGSGAANAQVIDLGQVHYVSHVMVQADQSDVYQLDVSTDKANWVPWYTVPTVSGRGLQTRDSGPLPAKPARYVRVYATSGDGKYSVSEVQVFANETVPECNGLPGCAFSVAELILAQTGAAPTAQGLQDFAATWTCESAPGPTPATTRTPQPTPPTPHTAHAVPWNGDAVASVTCLPSAVPCNTSQVTTCSVFAPIVTENGHSAPQQRPDDVVYENVAQLQLPICPSQYSSCSQVIVGKTNYYQGNSASPGTHDDPACLNVQRAIHDAIADGSCPAGLAADANSSKNVWPYNLPLGSGQTSGCLPYPVTQPALLPFVGCGPYVQ